MCIVTYAAANGLTIEEAKEVLASTMYALPVTYSPDGADEIMEGLGTTQPERASVEAMMEALINRGPRDGRPVAIGSARAVPLAYTHR